MTALTKRPTEVAEGLFKRGYAAIHGNPEAPALKQYQGHVNSGGRDDGESWAGYRGLPESARWLITIEAPW
ncbi:MAG: hypothetical protein HYY01_14225 [Chloroflexi bacterium]|nr:hypothetical protein [Chloroflexota bacterium]